MRRPYAGAVLALALDAAALAGCTEPGDEVVHRVVPHPLAGCPADPDGEVEVRALGDFPTDPSTTERFAPSSSASRALSFPAALGGAEIVLRGKAGTWNGFAPADAAGSVDATLWPAGAACDATAQGTLPSAAGGEAMTAFANGARVLVAGGFVAPGASVNDAARGLVFDVRTGAASEVAGGMVARRAFASATPFGDGVLVAGGIDPAGGEGGVWSRDAEVFSGDRFDGELVALSEPRARHGAVVLASGETLLVGGEGAGGRALASVEAVDPATRRNRLAGLGALVVARKSPTALRLANDEILVAGGTDDDDRPVSTIEWLAPDGSACVPPSCVHHPIDLVARRDRAFVALAAGGALAVGGVDPATLAPVDDAWLVTPDGAIDALPPLEAPAAHPELVPASDGAPWLWDGQRWRRFDPWSARFVAASSAPSDGPEAQAPAPVAVDPGLFVWIARDRPGDPASASHLRGFRHGLRNALSRDVVLLLDGPEHVAPDRLPAASGALAFDAEGLHLAADARAVVADTTYDGVEASAESRGAAMPRIALGGVEIGGAACPWPASGSSFDVVRDGARIHVAVGGASASCDGPRGRIAIGLRAPEAGEAIVRALVVTRRAAP